MTAALRRRAEDIDVWTRAFAEEQAGRAGMPLRAWLDKFVADEEAARAESGSAGGQRPLAASGLEHPPGDAWSCADSSESTPAESTPAQSTSAEQLGLTREVFGQGASGSNGLQTAAPVQGSVAAMLEGAIDDADRADLADARLAEGHKPARDLDDEPGGRDRVDLTQSQPRRHMEGSEIEQMLSGPVQEADATIEVEAHTALSDIELAMRLMREQIDAAEQVSEAREPEASSVAERRESVALGQASAAAIAQLGLDVARLVEVMDRAFDGIEAASTGQALELRRQVVQMFDELASRIGNVERRSVEAPGVIVAEPSQVLAPNGFDDDGASKIDVELHSPTDDATAACTEAPALSVLALPAPSAAAIGEAMAAYDPDLDLFDDPPLAVDPDSNDPFGAPAAPIELGGPLPPALPTPPTTTVNREPLEAPAAYDPDSDLFDDPLSAAGADPSDPLDAPATARVELGASSPLAVPKPPTTEVARPPFEAPATDDPDPGLFDHPRALTEGGPLDPFEAAPVGSINPDDWPLSDSPARSEADGCAADLAFDARPSIAQVESAPGWQVLDDWPRANGSMTEFEDPLELSDEATQETITGSRADATEEAARLERAAERGGRLGLRWLRFPLGGRSRKKA